MVECPSCGVAYTKKLLVKPGDTFYEVFGGQPTTAFNNNGRVCVHPDDVAASISADLDRVRVYVHNNVEVGATLDYTESGLPDTSST